MRKTIKLGLFLCLVAGLAGLAIAFVHEFTEPLIAQQLLEEKLASFQEVYPGAELIKDETEKYLATAETSLIQEVNLAYQAEEPVAVIYLVEAWGYNDQIQLLVGLEIATEQITAIKVLQQAETPGLGAHVEESFFTDRFRGKSARADLKVVRQESLAENQILAITSATITSQAATDGVNAARRHFVDNFGK